MGGFCFLELHKVSTKDAGFIHPLLQEAKKPDDKRLTDLKQDSLGLFPSGLFIRDSHEGNSRVQSSPKNTFFQQGALFMPNINKHGNGKKGEKLDLDEQVTQLVRNAAVRALCSGDNKFPKNEKKDFTRWDPSTDDKTAEDATTGQPHESLDKVIVDEDVGIVMQATLSNIFADIKGSNSQVFEKMEEEGIDGFYSRHQDGKYSDYAISNFGFPDDVMLPESGAQ